MTHSAPSLEDASAYDASMARTKTGGITTLQTLCGKMRRFRDRLQIDYSAELFHSGDVDETNIEGEYGLYQCK